MKNDFRTYIKIAAVIMLCVIVGMCIADGRSEAVSGSDADVVSSTAVLTAKDADDEAAKEVLVKYFTAFNTHNPEMIADLLCSEPMQALGQDRAAVVERMQTAIDNTAAQYGDSFCFKFDKAEFVCDDLGENLPILNDSVSLTDAPVQIDALKAVTATVQIVNSEGVEGPEEAAAMMVYRYNGQWYLYGYAG